MRAIDPARERPTDGKGLTAGHYVGAAHEHYAAYIFQRMGYMVLWPSPQQSVIDFVIHKGTEFKRVQVKTATWNRGSPPYAYLQCRTRLTNLYQDKRPDELYDIMCCIWDHNVWIIPAEAIDSSNIALMNDNPAPRKKPNRWDQYRITPAPTIERQITVH